MRGDPTTGCLQETTRCLWETCFTIIRTLKEKKTNKPMRHNYWAVKNPSAMQETRETQVPSPGQEDPLEKEMAIHSSVPAWEFPRTEEPGGLQSTGCRRVGHDWVHEHKLYLRACCVCVHARAWQLQLLSPHAPTAEASVPWSPRSTAREVTTMRSPCTAVRAAFPCHRKKATHSNEDAAQPKTNISKYVNLKKKFTANGNDLHVNPRTMNYQKITQEKTLGNMVQVKY